MIRGVHLIFLVYKKIGIGGREPRNICRVKFLYFYKYELKGGI